MLRFVVLCVLGALACAYASELRVLHPTFLKRVDQRYMQHGKITAGLGNFGHFNYGTTIKGRLHYPLANQDGCREFKDEDFNQEHLKEGQEQKHQPFIMVDRGNCHFTKKSLNIQKYGGVLAIIVDSKAGEDPEHLMMADDSQGSSISIPTFNIALETGTVLKDAIHQTEAENQEEGKKDEKAKKNNLVIL